MKNMKSKFFLLSSIGLFLFFILDPFLGPGWYTSLHIPILFSSLVTFSLYVIYSDGSYLNDIYKVLKKRFKLHRRRIKDSLEE